MIGSEAFYLLRHRMCGAFYICILVIGMFDCGGMTEEGPSLDWTTRALTGESVYLLSVQVSDLLGCDGELEPFDQGEHLFPIPAKRSRLGILTGIGQHI